jgi:hypothetical protein
MAEELKYGADPDSIQKAIDAIGNSFEWVETPQGLEYWEQVVRNLESILDEVHPLRPMTRR